MLNLVGKSKSSKTGFLKSGIIPLKLKIFRCDGYDGKEGYVFDLWYHRKNSLHA